MSQLSALVSLMAAAGEVGPPTDPNWASVIALVGMNDVGTTFTDATGKTWTTRGDSAINTTSPPPIQDASGVFDGTGDWIDTPDHADFTFGTNDLTIEAFVNLATTGDRGIYGQWGSVVGDRALIFAISTTKMWLHYPAASRSVDVTLSTGTWYYVGFRRTGTTGQFWLEGSQAGSNVTMPTSFSNSSTVPMIAAGGSAAGMLMNGRLAQVRVTNGVYRDLSVVPTAPFPTS